MKKRALSLYSTTVSEGTMIEVTWALVEIYQIQNISPTAVQLAKYMGLSQPTVSKCLKVLVANNRVQVKKGTKMNSKVYSPNSALINAIKEYGAPRNKLVKLCFGTKRK